MRFIRRANERFHTQISWLDSWHTYSFGHHFDPRWQGFGNVLVINDDTVAPGGGFGTHGHRDMEIVSYVVAGALSHNDSMGNGSTIRRGDVQRMSAGTGVRHSEMNAGGPGERVHFLQLWFPPSALGIAPGYEQRAVADADRRGKLALLAAPPGEGGVVSMHADARLLGTLLEDGEAVAHRVAAGRGAWVHIVTGEATVDGEAVSAGDGVGFGFPGEGDGTGVVRIAGGRGGAEILVFDVMLDA